VSNREVVLINTVETMARNLGFPVVAGIHKPLQRQALAEAFAGWTRALNAHGTQPGVTAVAVSVGELEEAIAGGHIHVHYQPKLDLARGVVCGVEALARWRLASGEYVGPDRFIPLAEGGGLIRALGATVMERARPQAVDGHQPLALPAR
jgi:hypothetical protein